MICCRIAEYPATTMPNMHSALRCKPLAVVMFVFALLFTTSANADMPPGYGGMYIDFPWAGYHNIQQSGSTLYVTGEYAAYVDTNYEDYVYSWEETSLGIFCSVSVDDVTYVNSADTEYIPTSEYLGRDALHASAWPFSLQLQMSPGDHHVLVIFGMWWTVNSEQSVDWDPDIGAVVYDYQTLTF